MYFYIPNSTILQPHRHSDFFPQLVCFLSNLYLLTNDQIVGTFVCMVVFVYRRKGTVCHMLSKRRASLARDKFFKRFTVVSLQNFSRTFCRAINTEIAFIALKLKPATVKHSKAN